MVGKTKFLLLLQEYTLITAFNWQCTILLEAEKQMTINQVTARVVVSVDVEHKNSRPSKKQEQ